MINFWNKQKQLIISFIVGIILIIIWLHFIDIKKMLEYFREINFWWVIISLVIYVLAYFIRSIRWRIILRPVTRTGVMETFYLFMAGMLINYVVPIRAGELAKGYFLKKTRKVPMSKSLPTVFFDKMMDLLPVLLLFILIPFIARDINPVVMRLLYILLGIFVLFLLIIIFCIIKKKYASNILKIFFIWLPKKWRLSVNNFIERFVEGMSVIKNPKIITVSLLLTLLAVLLDSLYILTMFKAFGCQMAFIVALFGYTLVNLSYILPTPPAQIGSNEAIFVIVFTLLFGIDKNLVSAAMAFAHLTSGTIIFLLGFLSLNWLGLSFGQALNFRKNSQ